ncbi:MAG: ferredoxin family protein [Burkholderiales bacterium]|nr:ferredoxin family protein [Burkholderiales bacterium]
MPIEKIDLDLCDGCGLCDPACPEDVIRIDEETHKAYVLYRADCVACYNCEIACPQIAIYVSPLMGTPVTPAW